MSSLVRNIFRGVLVLAIVLIAVRYVDFSVIWRVSFLDVIAVMLVVLVANIARFYTLKLALSRRGIRLRPRQWLGLGVYSALLNLFLPLRAGLSIKAIYLKREYNFRYAEFLGTQSAVSLLQVYVLILAGVFCGLIASNVNNEVLILLLAFVMFGVSAPFVFKLNTHVHESKILRTLYDTYNSFLHLVRDVQFIGEILVNMFVILVFTGFALYFSFKGLGVEVGLAEAILIGVAVSLLSVVSITPGNIGVQEFVVAFMGHALGGSFDIGFVAMLLVRVASVLGFFLLSPVGIGVGIRSEAKASREAG